eukprot:SAG11_NODE_31_length_23119_cov_102.800608_10_plen_319_part_00
MPRTRIQKTTRTQAFRRCISPPPPHTHTHTPTHTHTAGVPPPSPPPKLAPVPAFFAVWYRRTHLLRVSFVATAVLLLLLLETAVAHPFLLGLPANLPLPQGVYGSERQRPTILRPPGPIVSFEYVTPSCARRVLPPPTRSTWRLVGLWRSRPRSCTRRSPRAKRLGQGARPQTRTQPSSSRFGSVSHVRRTGPPRRALSLIRLLMGGGILMRRAGSGAVPPNPFAMMIAIFGPELCVKVSGAAACRPDRRLLVCFFVRVLSSFFVASESNWLRLAALNRLSHRRSSKCRCLLCSAASAASRSSSSSSPSLLAMSSARK